MAQRFEFNDYDEDIENNDYIDADNDTEYPNQKKQKTKRKLLGKQKRKEKQK